MGADVSSVEIRLNAGKPACILDGALALSPCGPLLSHRLAHHWPVWIVRSLWPLIDSDHVYRNKPELLECGGAVGETPSGKIMAEALSDWHALWATGRLSGSFHWVGDVRHESNLPSDLDDLFPQRFEVLASALMNKRDRGDDDEHFSDRTWRETCAYEAVALAAALSDRAAVIVTVQQEAGERPHLIRMLDDLAFEPEQIDLDISHQAPLALPQLVRIGMPPSLLRPYRLIAVHVSAPKALLLPWGAGGSELWGEPSPEFAGPHGKLSDPWAGARAAWHTLR